MTGKGQEPSGNADDVLSFELLFSLRKLVKLYMSFNIDKLKNLDISTCPHSSSYSKHWFLSLWHSYMILEQMNEHAASAPLINSVLLYGLDFEVCIFQSPCCALGLQSCLQDTAVKIICPYLRTGFGLAALYRLLLLPNTMACKLVIISPILQTRKLWTS